ncbi:MAG TPA: hypothetical protein VIG72_08670 [Pontibacter sp.]
MYAKILLPFLGFLLLFVGSGYPPAQAQTRQPFTGRNLITVTLEGAKGRYEFRSQDLLVRYNRATEQLECSVLVNSLLPASDTIPAGMVYDVLYGARFPEFTFVIDVPKEIVNGGRTYAEPIRRRTSITLQGTTNEKNIAVVFAPEKNRITFGTDFDLVLANFQASIPAHYLPVLTGRLLITISNARWVDKP